MARSKHLFRTSAGSISSFSTVIGITLSLTIVGILYVFILVTHAVKTHFSEQLTIQLMLQDEANEADILALRKKIESHAFTHSVSYISKIEAAQIMQEELGEDFVSFLGFNPLPASLDIKLNAQRADGKAIQVLENQLGNDPLVREIVYEKALLQHVNENIGKWGTGLFILGSMFLIIAIVLIANTIELAIFSQRFIIKSMQLVGATHWFIQRPFLKRGLWYGFLSSILALIILMSVLYSFQTELKDVIEILRENGRLIWLLLAIFLTGLVVSLGATLYAVRRFVRLETAKLY
jgi:cell division transport system permease protein